jgi:hypothetical protein
LAEINTVSKNRDSIGAAVETKGMTHGEEANAPAFNIRKRIGSTAYEVEVYFNPDSRETLCDKILRLIRGEAGTE